LFYIIVLNFNVVNSEWYNSEYALPDAVGMCVSCPIHHVDKSVFII